MDRRIWGIAALVALAGCADPSSQPVTEEMFGTDPTVTGTLPAAGTTTVAPLDGTGQTTDPAAAAAAATAGGDPFATVQTSDASGLTERLPDTCKLAEFQQFNNQNAATVEAAGIAAPYRVIAPNTIVTQEYNPMRVNFYLGGNGRVNRISCG
ncbi:peptidase inhibitor I78 family protein [Aliiruegeria haliotis]|uniref:Peptidase inhibitor I78 family protein n=1 Tax=Aliiruegeria haliotis TaxID=1280846 RepID=A0A2T0RSK0_9RHOB|nr:I78 family peptidase inhibitor [Aliiruegeria haliotis]PRY24175.1 peptidase inhibitor I78 family protein [Aliiruegeria haliotis]